MWSALIAKRDWFFDAKYQNNMKESQITYGQTLDFLQKVSDFIYTHIYTGEQKVNVSLKVKTHEINILAKIVDGFLGAVRVASENDNENYVIDKMFVKFIVDYCIKLFKNKGIISIYFDIDNYDYDYSIKEALHNFVLFNLFNGNT